MALADISDPEGRFMVLAADHRDSLRTFLAPDDPGSVTASDLTQLKIDLARVVSPHATGMMLDPEYAIPQVTDAGVLADGVGFIAALESQGYTADPVTTVTEVLPGWSAAQAADAGAACAKLLLPYHPGRATAGAQEAVVAEVVASCRSADLPLVLEPVAFALDDPSEHTDVVLESIRRLQPLGPDLLKLPFPGAKADVATWSHACSRVAAEIHVPWTVLSGGGSFEDFADQVRAVTAAGANGFMVGRALWGEAARVHRDERQRILVELVVPRFERLIGIVRGED